MARRGPEGYGLVQPPLMGRDARRPSRTESFAKLMPAIPFAQGGEYFSSSAGWQQRLAYTCGALHADASECDLGRRIIFAIACGGTVGYERRRVDRPAGIRTMALVALGACVFTITSIFAEDGPMSWDSSRVAAAIPSGVGFLGAGLIWKMKVRSPLDPDGPEHEQIHG
ncbi:MgtC-like protein [Aureococcus anophagefferens]|nr:MgtC-like protein [Aureococcus anophagefferens]